MSRTAPGDGTPAPSTPSHPAPPADSGAPVRRRTLLFASGGLATAAAGGGLGGVLLAPSGRGATARPAAARPAPFRPVEPRVVTAPYTAGTTLAGVATPHGSGDYQRFSDGPGWQQVVRPELGTPHRGREGRRTVLACFVQLTDLHLTDVQSPLRLEFLRSAAVNTWRPHEALTVAGMVSLVERINALPGGPVTGAALSFTMSTGDNCDNNSRLELDWFLTGMNGGRITPDSGDPRAYEGVQNSGLDLFWQPESPRGDADKRHGFPHLPGYLAAATRPVTSPGLRMPWYSTAGNHDGLAGGLYALTDPYFTAVATGTAKLQSVPAAESARILRADASGGDVHGDLLRHLFDSYGRQARTVTADPRRAPFSRRDYIGAHLDARHTGPGPAGHGFTAANLAEDRLYYSFPVADGVLGVSLDTTDRGGDSPGSIGTAQLTWLDRALAAHHDQRVLVFSHHTSGTMTNTRPDPARPHEKRHTGEEVLAVLGRHRNVVAWINGHCHANRIVPRDGFWEITTASHVDHPQLARVFELTDNHDGTLSLFTTLVESAAPHRTSYDDLSPAGLAALYREMAYNRPGGSRTMAGTPTDRNTELLLRT